MLLIAYALSASLAIAAALAWPTAWALYAVLKTLTTLLVISHAWRRGGQAGGRRLPLLAGLLLSLVGDVALLWPQRGFLPGLAAFLLAHLAYLFAFTRGLRLGAWPLAFVAYALLAAAVLSVLWPGVPGALRLPVVAYVLCLAAMAAQTASAWNASHVPADVPDAAAHAVAATRRLSGAALGGALFVASDALLAINRFHSPLPLATLWILASYWAAQWLIASVLPPRR